MKFGDALDIILHGGRVQRAAWNASPVYGLSIERAGSGSYLAFGYANTPLTKPWRTAAIDVLANDWQECIVEVAPIRAYKDD